MATPANNSRLRYILGVGFAALAVLALVLGLIGGLRPEWLHGSKASSNTATPAKSTTQSEKTISEIISGGTKNVPVTPVVTTTSTSTAPVVSTTTVTSNGASSNVSPAPNFLGNNNSALTNSLNQYLNNAGTGIVASMQSAICAPLTGEDLQAALTGEGCTVINLAAGTEYTMPSETIITGRKIVIGNPLYMPLLDASGCPRLFRVASGGYLELRFVMTYRGGGELLYNPFDLGMDTVGVKEFPVLRGGSVHVMTGGTANLFGCIFTDKVGWTPPIFLAPDLSSLEMAVTIQGGQVYVNGGNVVITGCAFWSLSPGVVLREWWIQGGDVLVRGGSLIMTATTFTRTQLFINVIGVGAIVAQYAGLMVASGCAFTLNLGNLNVEGAGILVFQGGGVGIFDGCTWSVNIPNLDFFGAGVMLFQGGGVLVLNGVAMEASLGNAIACGVGVMIAQGGGTLTINGVTTAINAGTLFWAGAGIFNFLGGGSVTLTGYSTSRNMGVAGIYGVGGVNFVGTGILVDVGTVDAVNAGVDMVVVMGIYNFMGVGELVRIGHAMAINMGILYVISLGVDTFVGEGQLTLVGPSSGGVALNIGLLGVGNPSSLSNYYVNGAGFNRRLAETSPSSFSGLFAELAAAAEPLLSTSVVIGEGFVDQHSNEFSATEAADFVKAIDASLNGTGNTHLKVPSIYIKNAATCYVDGEISHIVGPGAGVCKQASLPADANFFQDVSSQGTLQPLATWKQATVDLFDAANNTILPHTMHMVNADLRIGTNGAQGTGLSLKTIEKAIEEAMPQDCARMVVSSTKNNQGAQGDELDSTPEDSDPILNAAVTEKFLLSYLGVSAECAESISANISDSSFANAIQKALSADGVVGVSVTPETFMSLPSIQNLDSYNVASDLTAATAATASPAVVLVGEKSSFPSKQVGDELKVMLSNFQLFDVQVDLTTSCSSANRGTFLFKAPKEYFSGGDHSITISTAIPNVPAGTYAVMATQLGTSSLSWCSNAFQVGPTATN